MKEHRLWMRTLLVGGGGLIAGLLLLSGGIARASDYVSVSAQTPADVVAIEEDGGTFTVVCIYYWPGASITLTVEPTSGSGFPPDVPGGGWGKENPKWWKTGKDTSLGLPYDLGSSTLTVSAPNDGEVFGFAVSCGDSRKAALFRPVDVESVTVSCSHGRGGSSYLEVVSPDTVSYAMTWNCESAIGTPIPPVWSASPALPLLSGNPGEVVSQSLFSLEMFDPVTYTATCAGKTATVRCYPETKLKVTVSPNTVQDVVDVVDGVLKRIADTVTYVEPKIEGEYSKWYEEQTNTIYVGNPWKFDFICNPLLEISYKAPFLRTHPLIVALDAAGIEAGPYVSLGGKMSAALTGIGEDVYGKLYGPGQNELKGEVAVAIGVEFSAGPSFQIDLNANASITASGSFEYQANTDLSVFLKDRKIVVGALAADATCKVKVGLGAWEIEGSIERHWDFWEGKEYPLSPIQLL